MNVINGGSHAGNKLAFQEFMIVPTGAQSFTEAMKVGSEVYHSLKSVIKAKYGIDSTNVGDEGGFAPPFASADEALEILTEAIKKAGYEGKVHISLDVASSEFYEDGKYNLDFKNPNAAESSKISGKELADVYLGFIQKYPIASIEDPFDQVRVYRDHAASVKSTLRLSESVIDPSLPALKGRLGGVVTPPG